MKAEQVVQAMRQRFIAENQRLVFRHDQEGEFANYLKDGLNGELATVRVLYPGQVGCFSAMLLLEQEDPGGVRPARWRCRRRLPWGGGFS